MAVQKLLLPKIKLHAICLFSEITSGHFFTAIIVPKMPLLNKPSILIWSLQN